MARLSDDERELLLADFHTGQFTQRQLSKKYEVSTATANRLTKGLMPKHEGKVNAIVKARAELDGESEQEVNAVNNAVEDKTKHLLLINRTAALNVKKMNKLLKKGTKLEKIGIGNGMQEFKKVGLGSGDFKNIADAVDKAAITLKVAERHAPKIDINNTNAIQNNSGVLAIPSKVSDKEWVTVTQIQQQKIKKHE